MSPKDITAVAIKFFGIYLMVNIILYFPVIITSFTRLKHLPEQDFNSGMLAIIVGAFIILGFSVSYILFRIANSIASKTNENTDKNPQPTQEFLLQLLGIYLIVSSLSVIPGFSISLFKEGNIDTAKVLYGFGYVFQVMVGSYILINPVVWGQWLNKLRGRS